MKKNTRIGAGVLVVVVVLLGVMGITLPPELARQLEKLGIPVPASLVEAPAPELAAPEALPDTAGSFSTVKRWLYEDIYFDYRQTFVSVHGKNQ